MTEHVKLSARSATVHQFHAHEILTTVCGRTINLLQEIEITTAAVNCKACNAMLARNAK